MEAETKFKDGDIFHWRWKESINRSMHCKSGIAIAKDGRLHDTFWNDFHSREWVDLDLVEIEFKGNPADMKEIREDEAMFYQRRDLVNMNHSNNSRAPIYVKAGAGRCPVAMQEFYTHKRAEAERHVRSFQDRMAECDVLLAKISVGDFDGYFPAMLSPRY